MAKSLANRKKQTLINNEYYNMQQKFDTLYKYSNEGRNFYKLFDMIVDKNNIKLAYRNIQNNKGANTPGVDGLTIDYLNTIDIIEMVKRKLLDYNPKAVKRIMIDNEGKRKRPFGIPTIEDRLIQQCILQIFEPICEAKFYNHSYGFRPNRNTHHAIARFHTLANINKLHYVVDIDINDFFDNVNHNNLIRQLYHLGIRDKKVLSIIKRILKSEIQGQGKPTKGIPQGGILSPLLSNIVLNELDWWVASQWEFMVTSHSYGYYKKNGVFDQTAKYAALKKTKLKEMYIVRYADDFKIMCRDYKSAIKTYYAVTKWLKDRLGLEISEENSKITNLRKTYCEFLGFKTILTYKTNKDKWTTKSRLTDKSVAKAKRKIKTAIKNIVQNQEVKTINQYNAIVMGLQNYYKIASHVCKDFANINYECSIVQYNRLRKNLKRVTNKENTSETFLRLYEDYNGKTFSLRGITLFPIYAVKTKKPLNFQQDVCLYTKKGRDKIHSNLMVDIDYELLRYLMENPNENESAEFNDNRISKFIAQKGKCAISGELLEKGDDVHHLKGRNIDGADKFSNLMFVKKTIHILIHATDPETIKENLKKVTLDNKQMAKLNTYRKKFGNYEIAI